MSNGIYGQAALWVVALCGAAISLIVAYRFLCWLAVALWTQGMLLIEVLYRVLVHTTCASAAFIKRLAIGGTTLTWTLAATGALKVFQPIKLRWMSMDETVRENLKLRQLYWKYGHEEFDSFDAFKRSIQGEEQSAQSPPPSHQQTSFSEAQAVLGFSGDEPVTPTDLKIRYRKMISLVSSDKGFPTDFFAQQLNHAVSAIKEEKKWK